MLLFLIVTLELYFVTVIIYREIFGRFERKGDAEVFLQSVAAFVSFPSGKNMLQGYYFGNESSDRLIMVVPGRGNGAFDYYGIITTLASKGYKVFAYDATGCHSSEGKSAKGFSQTLLDLECAMNFIQKNEKESTKKYLLGHSCGGYAVCAAISKYKELCGVVSVNGSNTVMSGVMSPMVIRAGILPYFNYLFIYIYQVLLFGLKCVNISSVRSINSCKTPILLIHGINDRVISITRGSIISQKNKLLNPNAHCLEYKRAGMDGHSSLLADACGNPNNEIADIIDRFFSLA